jgi:putative SbcD/Mre11-related phosphoesterase
MLEPVPDEAAALADLETGRALVVADYHAGLEISLQNEGVELPNRAATRRETVLALLDWTEADRIVFLGDLATAIGEPNREEKRELRTLLTTITERVPTTIVKGNHDGEIEEITNAIDTQYEIRVTDTGGSKIGSVGFVHGHTWPSSDVFTADVVAMGHEHPMVRLTDEVGGTRADRVWLRGSLCPDPFETHYDESVEVSGELVVFPAFNDLTGGTWTNTGQGFLSPYLPDGIRDTQAYMLDGTRLGDYEQI